MKPTSAFLFSVWCGLINSSNHASAKTWLKSAASPAQGFGLTRFVGDDDDVNDGGVVDVTPLCGSSGNDCPPSEEEVQEELTAALEADEQVTVVGNVELGELLCDSLDDAPDSELLRFAISSTEAVVAQRTSYSVIDGDVFTDGKDRKIWMGDVVDPPPAEALRTRTVSMTWAEPCDVETFLLKVVAWNTDGTASIIKSTPCDAGSSMDICMVEVEVEFDDESEPLVAGDTKPSLRRLRTQGAKPESGAGDSSRTKETAQDIRMLEEYLSASDHEKEYFHELGLQRLDGDVVIMPSGRRLTCSTQLDVMILYSTAALEILGDITTEQMETRIAEAFVTTNQAMINSEIKLGVELVHVAQLPYTQEVAHWAALPSLQRNAAVAALRNTYHADLVQLVGSFPGTCGLGYFYTEEDIDGFSVVDTNCFERFSHTHEMGHNLGCYHNRENSGIGEFEYQHGHRHCTGEDPYRTIMSYSCDDPEVPRVNYFSNPDVTYLDKPTGTETENNARAIKEIMLTVANFRFEDGCTATGETCSTAAECCVGTCSDAGICEAVGCNGDPHLVGFRGQKFDFTGEDGLWYALVSDGPCHLTNVRITAPVPGTSEITYITGVGLTLCDANEISHTVEITVKQPHVLETRCPEGAGSFACLADGALEVVLDGRKLTAPGQVVLGDGVAFSAVNLPGECRSFGFEKYWLANEAAATAENDMRRRLRILEPVKTVSMSDWIISDALKTNPDECRQYVEQALQQGDLFGHQSEHVSIQITSPQLSLRISHGKVHQLAMRDPTDQFDLPDHVAYQMNIVFEDVRLGPDPRGLVGETITPVVDDEGQPVMKGSGALRGEERDYRVSGPFGSNFAQLNIAVQ